MAAETKCSVKLVGGKADMDTEKLIGYCHNSIHRGYITKNILKSHGCLAKNCHYFEKIDTKYWENVFQSIEAKARIKESLKRKKQLELMRKEKFNNKLSAIKDYAQFIADKNSFDLIVTNVSKREQKNEYIINYVTDDLYNDWYDYLIIAITLGKAYHCKFLLKHTKWPDGRYVSVDEWKSFRKIK